MWLRRGVGYPQDNLPLRVARDHVPDDTWHAQGHLQTTEGNVVHYAYIEHHSQQLSERFNICEIAYDRWGGVQMSHNLEDAGFTVVVFGRIPRHEPTIQETHEVSTGRKARTGGAQSCHGWSITFTYAPTRPTTSNPANKNHRDN